MSDDAMLARVTAAGAQAGMIDPTDAAIQIDVSALKVDAAGDVVGLEGAIAKLRETKPYLFREPFDPSRIYKQLEEIGLRDRDEYINRFLATNPDGEALVKAIRTGNFQC